MENIYFWNYIIFFDSWLDSKSIEAITMANMAMHINKKDPYL